MVRVVGHESTDTEATYTIDVIPDSEIALFHWVGPITLEDRLNNLHNEPGQNDVTRSYADNVTTL